MKIANKKSKIFILLFLSLIFSCKDLTELNINPNGVDARTVNPNLVLPFVLTSMAQNINGLGFGDAAGIMQHTQKDGWFGGHNSYQFGTVDWSGNYAMLNNNKLVYDRSVELGLEFHQGVTLVMKSMIFGWITDLWGDAPYTSALKGDQLGDNMRPTYDDQETIYDGIIADLETANTLLSKDKSEYQGIVDEADVFYGGNPVLWRKLANSLMLRYYMRISAKKPDVSKAGIEKIVANPDQYPIITSSGEDAAMGFPGATSGTSWPHAIQFDLSENNYSRIKMDSVFVETLLQLDDPRIGVWADKVAIPLVVDASFPPSTDEIVTDKNGKKWRHLSPDVVGNIYVNQHPEYVGYPTQMATPSLYNLNPYATIQGAYNPHVSQLNSMYKETNGPLLKARILSAAEVHFILAEAALKGWTVGSARTHYEEGVKASFETWGVADKYATYIAGNAAYNGALAQVMEQKWIASWTAAAESWFDYRRTGLPDLKTGSYTFRSVLPVRFPYGDNETGLNTTNVNVVLDKLEVTTYTQSDGLNSSWSKPWLLQGTGKPW